jgi:Aspartyl protease
MIVCRMPAARRATQFLFAAMLAGGLSVAVCQESAPQPAQTTPANPATPDTTKPQQPSAQPGAGSQVQTGSVLGNGGSQSLLSRLAALLNDHQYPDVEKMLDEADASGDAGRLTPQQKQLYRGILANRDNKPEESIRLLQPLLDKIKSDEHPPEEKMLRKALAEDYLRISDWTAANQAYLELDYRLGGSMTPEERNEIELPVKLLPLAIHNPPMTVEADGGPFTLPYDRDPLGLTDVPVFVDAESHDWMLDPTAPFNLICRSTAKSVGLKISAESATVHTITGRPIQVHVTVIPRFTIGTVTLRNVTAFVFDDADYFFPQSQYQVRGVLGYPGASALGNVTVAAQSRIEVRPGNTEQRLTTGARFYLDGERVVAALGKPGEERMYAVDAGGQQTYLTSRYYAEHSSDFDGKKMELMAVPGAQQKPPAPAYVANSVTFSIGDTPVTLHYLQVLTQPLNAAAVDDTYGTLGIDALDEFRSYTFDYKTMRFGAKTE